MAVKLRTTKTISLEGITILVHAQSGAGKTKLIETLPTPIILSAEAGLLSLAGTDLPYIEVQSLADLDEAYKWITESSEAKHFESVALDSISEIAEVVLAAEKRKTKDGRTAYGALGDIMGDQVRKFRDLPGKHVYFSAKQERFADETGKLLYAPSMPGNKTAQGLPYFFDEVLALRVEKDSEGKTYRALQCQPDGVYQAKDRSDKLDFWMQPDLGEVIRTIKEPKQ